MPSYVNRKERIFCPTNDPIVCPPCNLDATYMRAQARLKSYLSCLDTRAWHLEDEKRRQHFLDSIKMRECFPLGQIVPVSVLVKTCPSESNTEDTEQSSVSGRKYTIGSVDSVEIGSTIGSLAPSHVALIGSVESSSQEDSRTSSDTLRSLPNISKELQSLSSKLTSEETRKYRTKSLESSTGTEGSRKHSEESSEEPRIHSAPVSQNESLNQQNEEFHSYLQATKNKKQKICEPGYECWRKNKSLIKNQAVSKIEDTEKIDVDISSIHSNVIEPMNEEIKQAEEKIKKPTSNIKETEEESMNSILIIEELQAENEKLHQELDQLKSYCDCYKLALTESEIIRKERDSLLEKLDAFETEKIKKSEMSEPEVEIHWTRKDRMHEDDEDCIKEEENEDDAESEECKCNHFKGYQDLQVHSEILEKELEYMKEALAIERENNAYLTAALEKKNDEKPDPDPTKMELERELRELRQTKCERDVLRLKIEKYAGLEEELCRLRYRAHEADAMTEKLNRHADQIQYFCQMECELVEIKNRLDEYNVVPATGESFADIFEQMIAQRNCLEYRSKDLEVKITTLSDEMVDLAHENETLQKKTSQLVLELNEELERKNLEIQCYKARLDSLEGVPEEFATLQQQLIQLVTIIDNLSRPTAEIEQVECQVRCIVARLRKCNDQFNPAITDQLMTFIVELQNKNCTNEKIITEMKNENLRLQTQNTALENRTSMMASRISSLEMQIKFADLKLKKAEISCSLVNDDCLILIRKEIESAQSKLFEFGLPEAQQIADSLDMFMKELEFVHGNFEKVHQKLLERKQQLQETQKENETLKTQLALEKCQYSQMINLIEKIDSKMKCTVHRFSNLRSKIEDEIKTLSDTFYAVNDENIKHCEIINALKNDWHFSDLYSKMNQAVKRLMTMMERMDDIIQEKNQDISSQAEKITKLENENQTSRDISRTGSTDFIKEIMDNIMEHLHFHSPKSSGPSSGCHTPYPSYASDLELHKALIEALTQKTVKTEKSENVIVSNQSGQSMGFSIKDELLSIVSNLEAQVIEIKQGPLIAENRLIIDQFPISCENYLAVTSLPIVPESINFGLPKKNAYGTQCKDYNVITCEFYLATTALPLAPELINLINLKPTEKPCNKTEVDREQLAIVCKNYLTVTALPTTTKKIIEVVSDIKPVLIEETHLENLDVLTPDQETTSIKSPQKVLSENILDVETTDVVVEDEQQPKIIPEEQVETFAETDLKLISHQEEEKEAENELNVLQEQTEKLSLPSKNISEKQLDIVKPETSKVSTISKKSALTAPCSSLRNSKVYTGFEQLSFIPISDIKNEKSVTNSVQSQSIPPSRISVAIPEETTKEDSNIKTILPAKTTSIQSTNIFQEKPKIISTTKNQTIKSREPSPVASKKSSFKSVESSKILKKSSNDMNTIQKDAKRESKVDSKQPSIHSEKKSISETRQVAKSESPSKSEEVKVNKQKASIISEKPLKSNVPSKVLEPLKPSEDLLKKPIQSEDLIKEPSISEKSKGAAQYLKSEEQLKSHESFKVEEPIKLQKPLRSEEETPKTEKISKLELTIENSLESREQSKPNEVETPLIPISDLEKSPEKPVQEVVDKPEQEVMEQEPVKLEKDGKQKSESQLSILQFISENKTLKDELEKLKSEKAGLELELYETKKLLEECEEKRQRESRASLNNLTMIKREYENVSKILFEKHQKSIEELEQTNYELLESQAKEYEHQINAFQIQISILESEISELKKQLHQTNDLEVVPVLSMVIPANSNPNQTDVAIQAELKFDPKPCWCKNVSVLSGIESIEKSPPIKALGEARPSSKRLPVVASPSITRLMNKVLYEGFEKLSLVELHLLNGRISKLLNKTQVKGLQSAESEAKLKVKKLLEMESDLSKSQLIALERASVLKKVIESQKYAMQHLPDFSSICKIDSDKRHARAFKTEPRTGYLVSLKNSKYKDCICDKKDALPCRGERCPVDLNLRQKYEAMSQHRSDKKLRAKSHKKAKI